MRYSAWEVVLASDTVANEIERLPADMQASWWSFNLVITGSAFLWRFAARRRAQGMAIPLSKHGNAAAERHRSARRVGLSASMAAFRLL